MASVIYNRFLEILASNELDFKDGVNLVGVMLTTSAYTPNIDTHLDRADVTNEIVGAGYATKIDLDATVAAIDTANDRIVITLPGTTWTTATITNARYAIYFLDSGVAGTDLLIAANDFGSDVSSTAATFTLNASTITIQNNSVA